MVLRGTYCLCINNEVDVVVEIGALGPMEFKEGKYIYVGSALNSLEPRVKRHIESSTGSHNVIHWHIDYLLHEPSVSIEKVYAIYSDDRLECEIACKVYELGEAVKRFGCSDCNCVSHLFLVDCFGFLEKVGLKEWV